VTGLVVGAAIVREGRVLAALRPGSSASPGWEFPGGKVESGEEPAVALAREIDEELGVEVAVDAFFPEWVVLPGHGRLAVAPARLLTGEPIPREHDALRWLAAAELGTVAWLPGDLPFLPRVRELLR
jgi:8-oxo-dGTP diphosphatase